MGKMSDSPFKQLEYACCSFITLATRAAVEGGLDADTAYSISDVYLQRLTKCLAPAEILMLLEEAKFGFARAVRNSCDSRARISYLEQAKNYIATHLNKEFDLETMAREIGINPSYLSRKFKEYEHMGDSVFCGTINRFGTIEIRASRLGEDSSLQKLIRMVEEAERKKAPMARIADRAASWLVPVALLIAIVAWIVTRDIVRAVTVLVVFCPCALVLATPTAIIAAIGQATKHGVIIKSGEALERMGKVDTVAFDKTGTLTNGNLVVKDIYPFDKDTDRSLLLRLTASAESYSEHPLAKAVAAYAKERNVELSEARDFHMMPGRGISAIVGGEKLFCGNAAFLKEQGVGMSPMAEQVLEQFRSQGKAVILAADAEKLLGAVTLSDTLRDASADMVERLREIGTHAVLLTGDHRQTAEYFAAQVGIADVRAELLPEQKVSEIAALQSTGKTVCMIGDGVNDAPALKTADVSVAMGAMGSDIAVEAADIALMSDDIAKIPYLKRLSNACVKTIRFSISLSLFISFVAITLSLLGVLTPTTGALVHNCGSCLVVLIAALLYDRKFE